MNKTEQAFEEFAATTDFTIEEMLAHKMTWTTACEWQRSALSQSEAPAEQPEDEREYQQETFEAWREEFIRKRGFPPHPLEVWQAAKRDALTQAPQERAAVTDEWIISAVSAAKIHFVHEGAATTLAIGHAVANALLSLAQSSEGKKP